MPWYCGGCGERRRGEQCKCGAVDAEQIPPLDGLVTLELRPPNFWGFYCDECRTWRTHIGRNGRRHTFIAVRASKRLVWWAVCSWCGRKACCEVTPPLELDPPTRVGQVVNPCKREIIPECLCQQRTREAREAPRPHVPCPFWVPGHDHKSKVTQERCEFWRKAHDEG